MSEVIKTEPIDAAVMGTSILGRYHPVKTKIDFAVRD
jgi:hypothetical protein